MLFISSRQNCSFHSRSMNKEVSDLIVLARCPKNNAMLVSPCLLVTVDSGMIDAKMPTVTARGCQLSLMAKVVEIYEDGYTKQEITEHALRQRYNILGPPACLPFWRLPLGQPAIRMPVHTRTDAGSPLRAAGGVHFFPPSQFILPFFEVMIRLSFSLSTATQTSRLFSFSVDDLCFFFH